MVLPPLTTHPRHAEEASTTARNSVADGVLSVGRGSVAWRVHVVKGKPLSGWQLFPSGSESSGRWRLLQARDRILPEHDQHLPFGRHIVAAIELVEIIERPETLVPVRPKEVVVGDPEGDTVIGAIEVVVAAGSPVGSLEGAVHTLYDLLQRPELGGDGIFVGQADDLRDIELEVLTVVHEDLLGRQRIGRIAIGDESEFLRKFGEMPESHAHGHNTGADTTGLGDTVTKDGSGGGVHDKPDEAFDASDLDVGLIADHRGRSIVVVVVHEGLYDKGGSLGVVSDLLVRDVDPVEIVHGLGSLAERQLQVHIQRQTKRHDVGIVL